MSMTRPNLTGVWIGILALVLPIAAQAGYPMHLVQESYRWRNDDGSQISATWKAGPNTNITGVARGVNLRVRFAIKAEQSDGGPDDGFVGRLEYGTSTNGPWTAVGVSPGRAFEMTTTTGYTNGQATTALLQLSGYTFEPGQCVENPANEGSAIIGTVTYCNIEYCFRPTVYAQRNTTYYFRLTQQADTNAPDTFAYTRYAALTIENTDPPPPADIYVDDGDLDSVLETGATWHFISGYEVNEVNAHHVYVYPWPTSENPAAWNRETRFNVGAIETNRLAFRWIPRVPTNATYDVYARWTYNPVRGRAIPYKIRHSSGTNEVIVNQRNPALSAKWNLLGTYTFKAGTNGWIEMNGNSGQACADAVWLHRVKLPDEPNVPPVANAMSLGVAEDTAEVITLIGIDTDGDALTYSIVTQPAHGTLSGTGASRTYTPAANYNGTDTFTFRANDGKTNSNVATVSLTVTAVNDAPICALTAPANGATYTAPASIALQATASDVDGTIAKVEFFNGATKLGQDTTSPYAYTWSNVAAGSYTLTVKATDNNSVTTTSASVSITVTSAANQPPTANAQSVSTAEDTAKTITLTGSDPEGAALTYIIAANPAHGTLTGTGASRTYTPAANYNGADSFTFKASDGSLTSTPATVSITVTAVNDAPTVTASGTPTSGTAPLTVAFTTVGTDADGDTLSYAWNFGDGTAVSTAQNPSHVYTSNGTYTAYVTASDGNGGSASAAVAITVNAAGGGNEIVILTIDPDTAYDINAGQEAATVMIKDTTDLTTPVVSVVATDANAVEPGATVNNGVFQFKRTSRFHEALEINYAIGGTASNGVDYNTLGGTVTIPVGVATKMVTVNPKADGVVEGAETANVTINVSTAYTIDGAKGAGTITIGE